MQTKLCNTVNIYTFHHPYTIVTIILHRINSYMIQRARARKRLLNSQPML